MVRSSGNTKTQNMASGSRMNSLKRTFVSSTRGCRVSLIAQLPSGQGHEEIFQRGRVRGQRDQLCATRFDHVQELRNRRRERVDAQLPAPTARRRAVEAVHVLKRALVERRLGHELDDMWSLELRDELFRRAEGDEMA